MGFGELLLRAEGFVGLRMGWLVVMVVEREGHLTGIVLCCGDVLRGDVR